MCATPRYNRLRGARRARFLCVLRFFLSLGGFALLWQWASLTGLFGRMEPAQAALFLPSPVTVAAAFWQLLRDGELIRDLGISLYRVMAGFLLGGLIGVGLGLFAGRRGPLREWLMPVLNLIQPIPGVAWVPLAIIWFGLGNRAAIFIIAVSSVFPMLYSAAQGLEAVDVGLVEAARTLGATPRQVMHKVILPSLTPYLVTGARVAFGFAWRVVIAAEMVGVPNGLGYLLTYGRGLAQTSLVLVSMVTLGLVMVAAEQGIFGPLEVRLQSWKVTK